MRKNRFKIGILLSIVIAVICLCLGLKTPQDTVQAVAGDYLYSYQIVNGSHITPGYITENTDGYYCTKDKNAVFVGHQHATGLCWAFSGALGYDLLNSVTFNETTTISKAWLSLIKKMEYNNYKIADGGNQAQVIDLINKYGIVYQNDMPIDVIYHINDTNYQDYYNMYSQYVYKTPYNISVVKFNNYLLDQDFKFGKNNANCNTILQIKNHIKTYGCVMGGVNSSYSRTISNKTIYYNNNLEASSNHAITIIGWDDDVSIVHKTTKETHYGAWIGVNSYGVDDANGMFYLSYDDVVFAKSVYGYTIQQKNTDCTVLVEQSNASFINQDAYEYWSRADRQSKIVNTKNVFADSQQINITYKIQTNNSYYNSTVKAFLLKDNYIIKDISSLIINDKITINSNLITSSGNYAIKFTYDKETDGVIDEKYYKEIKVLMGAEIVDFSSSLETKTTALLSSYNSATKVLQLATYSIRPKFKINIPSYSKLTNITIDGASVNLYAFTSATASTYAKGFIEVNFNLSDYKKYNYTLNCYSIDGNLLTLHIELYHLGQTDKVVFLDYANTNNIKTNANLLMFAIGDNYSDIYLQEAIGLEDMFHYWSTDKYGKVKLSGDAEQGFTLSQSNLTYCTQISNYTYTKDYYTAILYPNFVKNDFNVVDYKITDNCSVSTPLNHTIISASGGSGEYQYSVVSGMPNGLILDNNVIKGTPTQVGNHNIVIAVTDKILKITKQATLYLFVLSNNLGVYQTEWYDTVTSSQILNQGSITWPSTGPGGLHQQEPHKFALSNSGVLTCECRNYTNQANLILPESYILSYINLSVSNGHGGFDNYQLTKGSSVTFTPYQYTGASNAMIVYKIYMVPQYNVNYYLNSDVVYQTQKVDFNQNYQLISVPTQDYPNDLTFLGWSKQKDCNCITSNTALCTEQTNYYAVWQKSVKLTLKYDGNNYVSNLPANTVSTVYNQVLNYNLTNYKNLIDAYCVVANNLQDKIGYTFNGWDLSPDGTEKRFLAEDTVTAKLNFSDITIILYAIFDIKLYTITFDFAGDINSTQKTQVPYNQYCNNVKIPTKFGYDFKGYYSQPDGQGDMYFNSSGENVKKWDLTTDATLYACWQQNLDYLMIALISLCVSVLITSAIILVVKSALITKKVKLTQLLQKRSKVELQPMRGIKQTQTKNSHQSANNNSTNQSELLKKSDISERIKNLQKNQNNKN